MASKVRRIREIVWREGRFPKVWAFLTALPGIVKQILQWFQVDLNALAPYLPQPAWWWGLVVLALWAAFVIYSMGQKILSYETASIDIVPFRHVDGTWWLDVVNTGNRQIDSCVLSLERLENEQGERVFPQQFGLKGRPNVFPLRARQSKQAELASLREHLIHLHLLDGATETLMRLQDERYTAVVSVYAETDGANCVKRFVISRQYGALSVTAAT